MIRSTKFWLSMTLFQVLFGLAVFAITRQYYIHDSDTISADPTANRQSLPAWPERITETDLGLLGVSALGQSTLEDPVEISRQADEFFANRQYDKAAELYERLLVLGPNNVETYNNLGITLHYLGRSTEALRRLDEGVAVDPTYQRIWLTLGYVSSQLGNIEQARTALTNAAQIGVDDEIRRSAREMLENLP